MRDGAGSPYGLRNVRSAIGHYLLGRGAGAIAGLASAVLLVRHMPLTAYAGYTAVMGLAGIASMLVSLGLDRVATRYVPEARLGNCPALLRVLVWRLAAVRLLAAAALCTCLALAWPWVVRWFDFVTLQSMPLALAVYFLAAATSGLMATALQALVRQRLLTRISVLQWGGRLAWIAWIVAYGTDLGLQQVLWIMALPELAAAAVLSVAVDSALRLVPSAGEARDRMHRWPDWREVRHLAKHSYSFNVLASLPQGYFMRTLVAATLPVETVAAFGFFSNLVDRLRMYLPMQLMYNLIEPVMVARYLQSGDSDALNRNAQLALKINVIVLAFALIVLVIGGTQIIGALTNGRFVDEVWIVILLVFQLISGSQVLTMQLVLNVFKANRILTRAGLYALVVMLLFLAGCLFTGYPILILFGPLLYSAMVNSIARLTMRREAVPYQARLQNSAAIVLLAAIVSLAVRLATDQLNGMSFLGAAAVIISTLTGFLLLLVLFGLIGRQDVATIIGTVRDRTSSS